MDPLYRLVYNAKFWTSIGFCNKRCSDKVEKEERKGLEDFIEDIRREIDNRRSIVSDYMKKAYKREIEALNVEDKEVSRKILQDRINKAAKRVDTEARTELAFEISPWILEPRIRPTLSIDEAKISIMSEYESHSPSTTYTPSDTYIDLAEEAEIFDEQTIVYNSIRQICFKYKNEKCSKEILSFLEQRGL